MEKKCNCIYKKYIDEGLRDRAITRNLDWGIDVPKEGYEDKKIYIWAENVLGYLSVSKLVAESRGIRFEELWGSNIQPSPGLISAYSKDQYIKMVRNE